MTNRPNIEGKHVKREWKLHGKNFNQNYGIFNEANESKISMFDCGNTDFSKKNHLFWQTLSLKRTKRGKKGYKLQKITEKLSFVSFEGFLRLQKISLKAFLQTRFKTLKSYKLLR